LRVIKITVISSAKPSKSDINQQLQWFGSSLGLFGSRDKDKSCFRIFIALLQALQKDELLSSDEIAESTGLSRGTVVHHLNKLISQGIVNNRRSKYSLRTESLEDIVDYLKRDADEAWDHIKRVARDIDNKLGLKNK
jgi:predicted transcriptional regulator